MRRLLFECVLVSVLSISVAGCQGQGPAPEPAEPNAPAPGAMGAGLTPLSPGTAASATLSKGELLLKQAREAEASGSAERAIMMAKGAAMLGSDPEADLILGRVYEGQGQGKLALKHYRAWLKASPDAAPNAEQIKARIGALEASLPE